MVRGPDEDAAQVEHSRTSSGRARRYVASWKDAERVSTGDPGEQASVIGARRRVDSNPLVGFSPHDARPEVAAPSCDPGTGAVLFGLGQQCRAAIRS